MCCICHTVKTDSSGSGYESLVTCVTETAAKKLKQCSDTKQDNDLLAAEMAGKDWESIVAYEIRYHRSCYRSYTRLDKQLPSNDEAAEHVFGVVSKLIFEENCTLTPKELQELYNTQSDAKNLSRSRPILENVLERFNGRIALYKPTAGTPFLFNDQLSKGEIICHFQKELQEAKKKIESLASKDHDCIKVAAKSIREEIKKSPLTYPTWPPTSRQLVEIETKLPPLVKRFLSQMLCYRKDRISNKKQVVISSIGQDIVYNVTNGKNRTSKHAILSLCTKRRTGSKILLGWLNKLGHVISYDETR